MSDDSSKASAIVSFTDVFGLGSLSKSGIASLEAGIGRLYRPVALWKEGKVLIDLKTKAIIDVAKARAEAKRILNAPEASALEGVAAIEVLDRVGRLERQADLLTEGLKRAAQKDPRGIGARETSFEWMNQFLDMAERIDDAHIRRIWAEILAREITAGQRRMSLHALDSMRFMEARHAQLFDAFARTFLVFARCWRDGFDPSLDESGKSLLGRSDAHNDFRALAEMGFIEISEGDTPEFGKPSTLNFHRFAVRITPSKQIFNIQAVRPTMRGEELMRVLLDLEGDREDLSAGRFARDGTLSYAILDPERQALVLRRWFNHLFEKGFRIEVGLYGKERNIMNCDYQFLWDGHGLAPVGGMRTGPEIKMPSEIERLLA